MRRGKQDLRVYARVTKLSIVCRAIPIRAGICGSVSPGHELDRSWKIFATLIGCRITEIHRGDDAVVSRIDRRAAGQQCVGLGWPAVVGQRAEFRGRRSPRTVAAGFRTMTCRLTSTSKKARIASKNVQRLFHLYAYENCTLEGVVARLKKERIEYRSDRPDFSRTSIHNLLNDRAYIGEIQYRGGWYPGKHEPLIDRGTWNRVHALLVGPGNQQSHTMAYAGEFMRCGHCGHFITGELKIKKTKSGPREYLYYRCTRYSRPGHPRTRVTETELDRQMLDLFGQMRVEDESVRDWFRAVLASQTRDQQADSRAQRSELQRQATLLVDQQDRLIQMRLNEHIDEETFIRKQTDMRDRLASVKLQLDAVDRSHDETAELALKVFELSQTLQDKWLTADYAEKRRILEIVCLNSTLNGTSLCPTIRKPFDVLVEGLLVPDSGG